jgi:hypothetical protein
VRRIGLLVAGALLCASCVGKFALGVSETIDPTPILPGTSVRQEVTVEADGLLGAAVRQAMTQAAASPQPQQGTAWQVRDSSDGSTTRLRMSRTVSLSEVQSDVSASSAGGLNTGATHIQSDDWIVARRYAVRIVVPSNRGSLTQTTPTDPTSQQLAQAILAGVTFDYFLTLPGFVTATNGVPGDNSRLVWHLDISSTSDRVLTAESIFIDWPRLALVIVILLVLTGGMLIRGRARRASTQSASPPPAAM